jgi:hypothetical protein
LERERKITIKEIEVKINHQKNKRKEGLEMKMSTLIQKNTPDLRSTEELKGIIHYKGIILQQ